jgi:hypothetical protein
MILSEVAALIAEWQRGGVRGTLPVQLIIPCPSEEVAEDIAAGFARNGYRAVVKPCVVCDGTCGIWDVLIPWTLAFEQEKEAADSASMQIPADDNPMRLDSVRRRILPPEVQ